MVPGSRFSSFNTKVRRKKETVEEHEEETDSKVTGEALTEGEGGSSIDSDSESESDENDMSDREFNELNGDLRKKARSEVILV